MKTIHIYDRRNIMRRAHAIARQTREARARAAFDLDVRIVGARIIHNQTLSAHIAETPLDLSAAMKTAWAEAKQGDQTSHSTALTVVRASALAPLRRMRFARVFRLVGAALRFLDRRFIPSRAA